MNPHSDSGDWVYHYHRARAQQARAVGLAARRALRQLRRRVRDVLLALNGYPVRPRPAFRPAPCPWTDRITRPHALGDTGRFA